MAKQLESDKHGSVCTSEEQTHVTVITVKSVSYLFMLFVKRSFQYSMTLEGVKGEKHLQPVGELMLSFSDIKSMLDTAERKMFTNSASVTANYGKTFQNQVWPLAKDRGGALEWYTGEHKQGMGKCVFTLVSGQTVQYGHCMVCMVQDDPLLP